MSLLADLLGTLFDRRFRSGETDVVDAIALTDLTGELMGSKGEHSGQALARRILDSYAALPNGERLDFFRHLAATMDIDPARLRDRLAAYEDNPRGGSYQALMRAAEAPRQELIRRLNQLPGATGRLVEMRADLLALKRDNPDLAPLDADFQHLLSSWFNRGFLVLRPITWESPAHILEKIIAYEAVHAIDSWDDLRRRLEPADRRCFAFFHPAMPDEPLIFVEVALTRGIPGSIQKLLSDSREPLHPRQADTAVFYSISNCQPGLAGISFGNSLIKQVVADLSRDLDGISTYVTLSPVPGFDRWLEGEGYPAANNDNDDERLLPQLAAQYLLNAKRPDGGPLDPVARFHLGNGASLHAVHASADLSPKGMAQSRGVMVNYLYDLKKVAQNHERFAATQDITASPEVQSLQRKAIALQDQG